MKAIIALAAASALALSACATTGAAAPDPAIYSTAVANTARTDDLRKLDESRKPAEVLAFLGLRPGMAAADLLTGTGYWAQLMASVVGPSGSVTAFEPNEFYAGGEESKKLDALIAASPGVTLSRYPFASFAPGAGRFDFALINLSYHDLYWQSEKYKIPRTDPAAFVTNLYASMKPGGVVGVIDHVGLPGDTRAIVDNLHRIDPATLRADFERAGFRLEAESPLLANPADDHTKLVFDPAIRGKTDRFLYRFRKPRG